MVGQAVSSNVQALNEENKKQKPAQTGLAKAGKVDSAPESIPTK